MEKQYNAKKSEPEAQKKWLLEQTYSRKKHPGQLYSIDTPPPTVSGALHIGHIFSYTQTDILARYKRLKGYSVFYPFGFDDNGLPTERFVEKKHKVSPQKLGRSAFIDLCLQETKQTQEQFKHLWQRMGLSADWNHTYSTISAPVRKISQESFIRLYKNNFIYRKFEPALYCTTCRTAVAQAELDDAEKPSLFNYIEFSTEENIPLLIATTRPELLSSCVALFYHPEDKRYKHLTDKKAIVPIFEYKVPIYPDEQVNPEKGTGLVMCCSFGDKTDVYWIKKHVLPYIQSIGADGKWIESTGPLAGLKSHEAREKILELLKEKKILKEQKPLTHTVNVHERCKKEIEYVALSQWFLKILEFKKEFLTLAEQITWYPAFMKSRYLNWVENISWDWCLSRQRFYGIPFPAWHCKNCDEIILADIKDLPIDPQETPYPGKACPSCASSDIVPDTDVMDTWNTSSLTPYICYSLYNPEATSPFTDEFIASYLPMSMRPQAHDIIRTWAFYTIVKTYMHNQSIPWNDIVISGHVLSDSKEKLSKSKDQKKMDPEYLLNSYPADVIRYWTASASLGNDVMFSETQLKIGQRLLTKLWNAFKFIKEHTADVDRNDNSEQFGAVNEWLLHQISITFQSYQKHLDRYDFNLALDTIETFFWQTFCDNYLELIKDLLFNPNLYSEKEVKYTHWTLYTAGLRILQMYAAFLPHITEEIYRIIYCKKEEINSIHETKFSTFQSIFNFSQSNQTLNIVIDLIGQVRKLKTEHQLSLKTEISQLIIYTQNEEIKNLLQPLEQLIKGISRTKALFFVPEKHKMSALTKSDEAIIIQIGISE
ncbi:MAG: valine--tRNA ligase [Candidatus Babeliales bacterium]